MSDYIITRSDELAHYGIKGQKWGVRRYENEDGTLTEAGKKRYGTSNGGSGNEKLAKKYHKETKKLNKLKDQTDVDLQKSIASKYDKRAKTAAKIGVSSAAAAAAGYVGGIHSRKRGHIENANYLDKLQDIDERYKGPLSRWKPLADKGDMDAQKQYQGYLTGKGREQEANLADYTSKRKKMDLLKNVSDVATVAFGAAAVTSLGYATYSKVKSSVAKRRASDLGHSKAVAKYEQQCNKLVNMFKDTPYADIVAKQINR